MAAHWLVWIVWTLEGEHATVTEVMLEVCPVSEVLVWEPPQPARHTTHTTARADQAMILALFIILPSLPGGSIT